MDGMTASKVQKITFLIFKSLTLRQKSVLFRLEKYGFFLFLKKNQNFFDVFKIFDSNADSNGSRRARHGTDLQLFCFG